MTTPSVAIVMSPRERFSLTEQSIESLYANTPPPFEFVCVDAGSPDSVGRKLASLARRRGFKLIRRNEYLAPNQARNIAIAGIDTKYVAFVDNDTSFAPGWLEQLHSCAEDTGADIVSPIICIGEPAHRRIHFAGGEVAITENASGRHYRVVHRRQEEMLADIRETLSRGPCDFAEFHCMLARVSTLQKLGPLDETLKGSADHLDLCFGVRAGGGAIMFEPNAVITFAGSDPIFNIWGPPLRLSDLPYYALRWSDDWILESERYFHRKWNLVFGEEAGAVVEYSRRHSRIPWRRTYKVMLQVIGWRLTNRALDLSNRLSLQWASRRVRQDRLARG